MGNGIAKLTLCFSGCNDTAALPNSLRRRHVSAAAVTSEPLDEGLGHSFCYKIPDNFYSISGAAVSANASTALSTADLSNPQFYSISASRFDSTSSFNSYPLCPNPKFSGPITSSNNDRGFFSGPIEPGFLSGPLDPKALAIFSGPLDRKVESLRRSLSHGGGRLMRNLSQTIRRTISVPVKISKDLSRESSGGDDGGSLQWAQGKAGEDRVHVVVSEEFGWIFVGIYDGFNGPDATDYLLSNLYSEVQNELKEIAWLEKDEVLKAMSRALMKTEDGYFEMADDVGLENPELALMGSCVLLMLMKGEDVYLMNVGDSRAVLGQKVEFAVKRLRGKASRDLERTSEENLIDHCVDALQLTLEHSASVEEEVRRIQREHPDDACAVMNDRVKGSLRVTRAFGAGFLKQNPLPWFLVKENNLDNLFPPKWNDALLEVFRIDYVGTSPYITCSPFLYHHRLGPKDRFLILSSDGLYQYFTNEEAVSQVELFIRTTPDGDPAQHLVEEVIFRAAKKAGLDFHELLEIPQGDRRRYHDDVSIIVISFEGRIWRSCA